MRGWWPEQRRDGPGGVVHSHSWIKNRRLASRGPLEFFFFLDGLSMDELSAMGIANVPLLNALNNLAYCDLASTGKCLRIVMSAFLIHIPVALDCAVQENYILHNVEWYHASTWWSSAHISCILSPFELN